MQNNLNTKNKTEVPTKIQKDSDIWSENILACLTRNNKQACLLYVWS